jgi:hypothetical protein
MREITITRAPVVPTPPPDVIIQMSPDTASKLWALLARTTCHAKPSELRALQQALYDAQLARPRFDCGVSHA